ncbi:MAG: DsrE family protein [Aquificaceae bacterium]|nr:DsrE family protein [Aquificaceae bacterium]MCS7307351.1 DsrE family protein [Aquificaceae bacterium]
MKIRTLLMAGLMLASPLLVKPTWSHQHEGAHQQAKDNIILVVNLTTDKGMSPMMAVRFATVSLGRGNQTVVWLNSEAVKIADAKAKKPTEATKMLKDFISKGGKVYVCPHCAQKLGIKELIEGAEFGKPDIIFGALSQDRVRIVSW